MLNIPYMDPMRDRIPDSPEKCPISGKENTHNMRLWRVFLVLKPVLLKNDFHLSLFDIVSWQEKTSQTVLKTSVNLKMWMNSPKKGATFQPYPSYHQHPTTTTSIKARKILRVFIATSGNSPRVVEVWIQDTFSWNLLHKVSKFCNIYIKYIFLLNQPHWWRLDWLHYVAIIHVC